MEGESLLAAVRMVAVLIECCCGLGCTQLSLDLVVLDKANPGAVIRYHRKFSPEAVQRSGGAEDSPLRFIPQGLNGEKVCW